jgi:Cof subfamily protein (haloacid dehalogenase superfamily)
MSKLAFGEKFKLAAIDLDGTLLGHDGKVSPDNARAVRRLQEAGTRVVLASGRHYRNMQKYADALPGVEWLVSCQGGELSDTPRKTVLTREFLPAASVEETLALGRALGFSSIAYSVDGIFTDSGPNERLEFYADLAGHPASRVGAPEFRHQQIFKILWAGEAPAIEASVVQANSMMAPVQAVRTHQRLLEFMPVGVSKASALKIIAERFAIQPSEVIAFGDGDNDVPMFEWAGLSVAMAHGWPSAIQRATHVSPPGEANTALARAIDLVFENNRFNLSTQTAPAPMLCCE